MQPEILNKNLLGAQSGRCRWVNMGYPLGYQWVCFTSGGGVGSLGCANCDGCALKNDCPGLLGDELMSNIEKWIADWTNEVNYWKSMVSRFPNVKDYKDELANAQTQLAFWVAQRNKTPEELVNIGTGKGFQAEFNSFVSSLKNTYNKVAPQIIPGDTITAGIPIWGWVLLAGAGVYVVYEVSKKKR